MSLSEQSPPPPAPTEAVPASALRRPPHPVLLGHAAALLAVLLIAGLFLRSTHQLSQLSHSVAHTLDVINEVDHLLSLVKDAETSQRGFLLLGESSYLGPYEEARRSLAPSLEHLRALTAEDPQQQARFDQMDSLLQRKLQVLEQSLALARSGQRAAALEAMRTGGGQRLMDELRVLEQQVDAEEQRSLDEQNAALARASRSADALVLTGSLFLLAFIGFAAWSSLRHARTRERQHAEREALLTREQQSRVAAETERQRLRYQNILAQVPAAVGVYRAPDQRCELANPALQRLHGGRVLVGRTPREAHPEYAGDALFEVFDTAFRTGQPFHANGARVALDRNGDGTLVDNYLNFTYQPLLDPGGQVEAVLLFAVDVTEQVEARRAAEEALAQRERAESAQRASEERFRLIAETLPQLIWTTGADGGADYFNPRWHEYTGLTPEQGRSEGWVRCLHPEDMERTLATWRHSVTTGEPYSIEYRLRRGSDGTYRWFLARGLALRDATGTITQWFGTCVDIDEQKHGAESLRFLSEVSAVLAASLDLPATLQQVALLAVPALADWCIVDVVGREGHMERVGVAHADPSLGGLARLLRAYAPHATHPSTLALNSDKTVYLPELEAGFEERVTHNAEHLQAARDMKMRSLVSVPLLARGRTLGVMMFIHTQLSGRRYEPGDVLRLETVAHRAAMAIDNARLFSLAQEERQRAEEANRLKDDFLATVSHELRTPLTAMIGWLNLLRGGRLPAHKHAKALETVDRNAQAQAQLIEDLLDVSRIISGKLRLDMQAVLLGEIVQAALESVRPAADAKGIQVLAELEPQETRVLGDAGRLQQVVWNLLSNAVKFSPGERRVRVRLGREDSLARLTVEDEGPGIPADFLPHIFERFRQLEGGTTRRHGGLGLGLAIVRHLVELHGGTVQATSEGPGRGATFTVLLPLTQPRPATAEALSSRRGASPAAAPRTTPLRLAGRHLLVVDDEPDGREVLKMLLEDAGARVTTAASAAEAFQLLREHRPELLVSDVGMPDEDGHSLIARVRALGPEHAGRIPAVALTAYARVEDRARALAAGFDLHVAKPVEPAELVSLLAQLLARSTEALE